MPRCESELIPLAHPKHPFPHHFTAPSPPGCGNADITALALQETLKFLTIRLGLCYLGSDFLGGSLLGGAIAHYPGSW